MLLFIYSFIYLFALWEISMSYLKCKTELGRWKGHEMSEFYPKLTHAHLTLCASVRETESGSGQYKDV